MVTANQLKIVQSPITSLVSTVSTSVTVKLDDSNCLTWSFQIKLLFESHGIMSLLTDQENVLQDLMMILIPKELRKMITWFGRCTIMPLCN
ncbi:hypothetical protein ACFX12_024694 [Malus domestica]